MCIAGPGGVEGVGIRGVWSKLRLGKEPGGLCFFGKDDHVGWVVKIPVSVCPHGASTESSLNFVDDEDDVVFGADGADLASKVMKNVPVAAFALDGFDKDRGGALLFDGGTEFRDARFDLGSVLGELRDVGLNGGKSNFVERVCVCERERAAGASMKSAHERKAMSVSVACSVFDGGFDGLGAAGSEPEVGIVVRIGRDARKDVI